MLTNTYECLAIILRSLRLVANCICKPIRLIFATFWRICREYIFLHSQGYSPQCESSIREHCQARQGLMLRSLCWTALTKVCNLELTNAYLHCGEYPCECKQIIFADSPQWRIYGEWAYECNSPPIRNDRKVIARHSQVFVSIRGRSCVVANIMLLSHCGEYPCECKN